MKKKILKASFFLREPKSFPWLPLLIGILIALGVVFRLLFLDDKLVWADENCTLLRMSGYFESDFLRAFTFDNIVGADALDQFQRPNAENGIWGTVRGLAIEEPQLSPLYFVLLYKWIYLLGDGTSVIRLLSTLLSLLLFPALYWLCIELFQSALVAWVTIAMVAISPLHIVFAHEARPYSFWLLTFVISNAALLRAIRLNTRQSWIIYTLSIPLNIYTYLLTLFSLFAHGIYVFWHEKFRINRLVVNYLIAVGIGLIFSIKWLIVVVYNAISIPQLKGSHETIGLVGIVKRTVFGGIRNLFFDLNNEKIPDILIFGVDPSPFISLFLVGLSLYCFYLLWAKAPRSSSVFITALIVTSILPLMLSGRYLPRYLFPTYLLVQIIISFGLVYGITSVSQFNQKIIWRAVLASVFTLTVLASFISVQKETSWVKHGYRETQIASLINQSPNPLVISDTNTCTLLMLGRYLKPAVQLQVEPTCGICTGEAMNIDRPQRIPNIPDGFSQIFLYAPSEQLLNGVSRTHLVELLQNPAFGNSNLYLVK